MLFVEHKERSVVSLFGTKNAGWIGVDIGSSSVKLAAVAGSGKSAELIAYAIVSLPASAVIDGNVQEPDVVAEAIERGLKISGAKQKLAVTSVPSSAVITKELQISNVFVGMELEEQVRIEADQFVPYALDEVALDFQVIGPLKGNPQLNEILLVACRRDDVSAREDALDTAGLKCAVVDVDTYVVERVLPWLDRDKEAGTIGIVDIGASTLTLNVLRDGKVIYNREQAFGGNELTNTIHKQYGIDVAEVEKQLRMREISEEIEEMLVQPFASAVAQQVSRSLQFFYSSGARNQLDRLYLCGGVAGIDDLEAIVGTEIGVDTFIANPAAAMKVASRINPAKLEVDAPALVKAVGLALRSLEKSA
jgi:type IV pilus assembly protein PilM